MEVVETGKNHIFLACPDRDLLVVRHNDQLESIRPIGEAFDECLDLNLFNDNVATAFGLDYIMTNYAHHSNTSEHTRAGVGLKGDRTRVTVLSDSGGLQMARNVKDGLTISPNELIDFYNRNVDAGMVLDVPTPTINDPVVRKKASIVQKKMTEMMLKASKGIELINIFHGRNNKERRELREIVENPKVTRCAIGGVQAQGIITMANALYDIITHGLPYKQYHVLGVFKTTHIPILVSMSDQQGLHITSDSTNHIQCAVNRLYYYQADITQPLVHMPIGKKASTANMERILPCQCAVCRTVKYADVLGLAPTEMIRKLIIIHNMLAMNQYARLLKEARQTLTNREYTHLIMGQLRTRADIKEVRYCLDFVDTVKDKGLEAARKKYLHFLDRERGKGVVQAQNMFSGHVGHTGLASDTSLSSGSPATAEDYLKLIKLLEKSL
jgi:hypothetical protein